jgi:hypothetical protein
MLAESFPQTAEPTDRLARLAALEDAYRGKG